MRFSINPQTRAINNNYSKLGVQGENKIEVVEFVAPKIVGQADLSSNEVRCLLNATTPSNNSLLKELPISIEGDTVVVKWEVGLEETAEVGYLKMALHFVTAFDNRFRTLPTTFEVMETITVESEQSVLFFRKNQVEILGEIVPDYFNIGDEGYKRQASTFAVIPEVEVINVLENKLIIPAKLQNIAVQNDNDSKKIKIVSPRYSQGEDLSKYPIRLHIVTQGGDGRVPFTPILSETDITLIWTLERPYTSYSGAAQIQLEYGDMATDTFFKSTEFATVNILTALEGEPIVPVSPPEFLEYLRQIEEVKQEAVVAKDQSVSAKNIATTKANEASASAGTASTKASEAEAAASLAIVAKNAAAKSEANALEYKTIASTSAATSITEANRAKSEADRAASYSAYKGWFLTSEALKAKYPQGENGWWAIVGTLGTSTKDSVWTWDSDIPGWGNTQQPPTAMDYAIAINKPFINGVMLNAGENTLDRLGIQKKGDYPTLINGKVPAEQSIVQSVAGRTGKVALTKSDVGLSNVTNESKAAMFINAALTGVPTAPTAAAGSNTKQVATTEFVSSANANKANIGKGLWDIKLEGSGNQKGEHIYSARIATYYTVGDLVNISGRIEITQVKTPHTGELMITGLPFIALEDTGFVVAVIFSDDGVNNIGQMAFGSIRNGCDFAYLGRLNNNRLSFDTNALVPVAAGTYNIVIKFSCQYRRI